MACGETTVTATSFEQHPNMPSREYPSDAVVLIVESDPALRGSLEFILRIEGYTAKIFASGSDVLADPSRADAGCLVVDQRLPDTTGLDLIRAMRATGFSAPAILVANSPNAKVRQRAIDAGVVIVEKPVLTGVLLQSIATALRRQPARPWSGSILQ
jgi:two-component system response regulator FixJ